MSSLPNVTTTRTRCVLLVFGRVAGFTALGLLINLTISVHGPKRR